MSSHIPIQLRLQHEAGRRIGAVWLVIGPPPARALEALELPIASHTPRQPELAWNGSAWELRNLTGDARLYVNGEVLPPNSRCLVHIGDILEIGLCRIAVEAADVSLLPYATPPVPKIKETEESKNAEDIIDWPAHLPLDDILPGGNIFDLVHAVPLDEITSPPPASAAAAKASARKPADELSRLTQAYYQALRDPESNLTTAFGIEESAPAEQWRMPQLPDDDQELSLEELTTGKLDIDTISERFNDMGTSEFLTPDPKEDVLWLFAPPGEEPPAHRRPPPRSRQDHHVMTLDSGVLPGMGGENARTAHGKKA